MIPSRGLADAAVGAVVALIRVAELYDPAVAHRAALRALVAERLYAQYVASGGQDGADSHEDSSLIIATAALADIDLVVSQPDDPEGSNGTDEAPSRCDPGRSTRGS